MRRHLVVLTMAVALGLTSAQDIHAQGTRWTDAAIADTLRSMVGLTVPASAAVYPGRDRLWPWAMFYQMDLGSLGHEPRSNVAVAVVRDSLFPVRALQDLGPLWRELPASPDVTGTTLGWMCGELLLDTGFIQRSDRVVEDWDDLPRAAKTALGAHRWRSARSRYLDRRSEIAHQWKFLVWRSDGLIGVACEVGEDWGLRVRIDSIAPFAQR